MSTVARMRPVRDAERLLRADEDVVPEPRLEMRLHLRQIKVRPGAARDQLLRVVEKVEPEVEEARRHRLAVDEEMLLRQMPAARADDQRRGLVVQRVALRRPRSNEIVRRTASRRLNCPSMLFAHVGAFASSKSAMKTFAPRVERVDDHLAIDRPGDLDAAVLQIVRNRRDGPVAHRERSSSPAENRAARRRRCATCAPRAPPAIPRAAR